MKKRLILTILTALLFELVQIKMKFLRTKLKNR